MEISSEYLLEMLKEWMRIAFSIIKKTHWIISIRNEKVTVIFLILSEFLAPCVPQRFLHVEVEAYLFEPSFLFLR